VSLSVLPHLLTSAKRHRRYARCAFASHLCLFSSDLLQLVLSCLVSEFFCQTVRHALHGCECCLTFILAAFACLYMPRVAPLHAFIGCISGALLATLSLFTGYLRPVETSL